MPSDTPSAPPNLEAATISVIVPSWRRPAELARCLAALRAQRLAPTEVVVGARAGDRETAAVVLSATQAMPFPVTLATTGEAGAIAAMNAALACCTGEIIALTDDDAEPHVDWLHRIAVALGDPAVGAVGGRDWQPKERGDRTDVGRVQWFGRVIGNHHLGAGPARDVDVLKGVNLAVRGDVLRATGFDSRLRGAGAQMFWELALCLPMRRAGWRLVYDPAIAVDHQVAVRHDTDQRHRGVFVAAPQVDAVHNETLVLLEYLGGVQRIAFLMWAWLVGTQIEPGLAQVVRLWFRRDRTAVAKLRATLDGRIAGWRTWRAHGALRRSQARGPA